MPRPNPGWSREFVWISGIEHKLDFFCNTMIFENSSNFCFFSYLIGPTLLPISPPVHGPLPLKQWSRVLQGALPVPLLGRSQHATTKILRHIITVPFSLENLELRPSLPAAKVHIAHRRLAS